VTRYIKIDGYMEEIGADMDILTQLHKDLDTIGGPLTHSGTAGATAAQTTLTASGTAARNRTEDLIDANRSVWERWWGNKLRNNKALIEHAKRGNYEEVAKSIDWHYNDDDQVASINFQEPETGFTALHYAVKLGNHDLVNLLIESCADLRVPDAKGQIPLHLACI
jgi:hypothetical protein